MGENLTTRAIDLLGLPTGTRLMLGLQAVVEITGLRNPCMQLDRFRPGLMKAVLDRDAVGGLVRKAGVMAIVLGSGVRASGRRASSGGRARPSPPRQRRRVPRSCQVSDRVLIASPTVTG
jgi:MOSC domain-containing protein YiiM